MPRGFVRIIKDTMIIANPIYDVVFKRLMENQRIATFFIETLTGETVLDIHLKPQEFTYNDRLAGVAVYRLDFVATIKVGENEHKKVLIEIQKAKNAVDLMRFRNYLAEQYKKEDDVYVDTGLSKQALPIITIYLLGFRLDINAVVIKVDRQYVDLMTNEVIDQKSDFIEKLTHDCFIVQIPRIQPRLKSRLDMLLSLFEQNYFVDQNEITKKYNYPVDDDLLKEMIQILHHAGTDPDERLELEKEQEALRVFEVGMGGLKRTIEEKNKALVEKEEALSEKEKALVEKERAIAEQNKLIEELRKKLKDQ